MFWRKGSDSRSGQTPRRGLTRIIAKHVLAAAAFAVVIQTALCLAENFLDESYFTSWYVKTEVRRHAGRLVVDTDHRLKAGIPAPQHYASKHAEAYAYRIWDAAGRIIDTGNATLLERVSPITDPGRQNQDMWHLLFDPSSWFHVVGGQKIAVAGRPVWIEVATLGDPAGLRYAGLFQDLVEDVLIPQVPTILLTALIAILSVRYALKPLGTASALVEKIEPTVRAKELAKTEMHVETNGLPREVASFAESINRLLDRLAGLITSQDQFIARASHQMRTPLAVIMLELGKLKEEGARRIEADITAMCDMVDHLLELARMEAGVRNKLDRIDVEAVIRGVISRIEPLARSRHSRVSLSCDRPGSFVGDLISFREAIRNLVMNAIHHTHDGAQILVTCGPGATITVEDDGPGLEDNELSEVFEPFMRGTTQAPGYGLGLTIVRQAVLLNKGSLETGRSSLGGAKFSLRFC